MYSALTTLSSSSSEVHSFGIVSSLSPIFLKKSFISSTIFSVCVMQPGSQQ